MGHQYTIAQNGDAGAGVWLEFKTTVVLTNFNRVELQIGEGDSRIMSAPLLASEANPASVTAHFSAFQPICPRAH